LKTESRTAELAKARERHDERLPDPTKGSQCGEAVLRMSVMPGRARRRRSARIVFRLVPARIGSAKRFRKL
jgi:hypothetical protein